MNFKIFILIATFVAITCAESRSDSNIQFQNGNIVSGSKLISVLGRANDDNGKIQIKFKRDNAKLDSDKLVGFVPVKNSRGDTYLIPKEAIQAIQKQYDEAGNHDGAILVPESIIEIDTGELNNEEKQVNAIDKAPEINKINDDDIIAVIEDPELLGRQYRRRRRPNRRQGVRRRQGNRRVVRRRSNRRRNGQRRVVRRQGNNTVVRRINTNRRRGNRRRISNVRRGNNNTRRVVVNSSNGSGAVASSSTSGNNNGIRVFRLENGNQIPVNFRQG